MQCKTQKYHAQATSAAGSCSQHGITIHQKSSRSYHRFLSRNISIAQGTV